MRKILVLLVTVACLFGTISQAQVGDVSEQDASTIPSEHYLTRTVTVEGGSNWWTNVYTYSWQMASIVFPLETGRTNTFTVRHRRNRETKLWKTQEIVTNSFGDQDTNYFHSLTGVVIRTTTSTLLSAVATNVSGSTVTLVYGQDVAPRLPRDFYVIGNDSLEFVWTYTNATDMIINGIR